MTPEQELRSEMERVKGHAIRQGYGWRTAAAVGRLLEPIPDEVREQMFQGLPTSHVIEWYRAWLIGGSGE